MMIDQMNTKNNNSITYSSNTTNLNNQIMVMQGNIYNDKNELKLASPCLLLSGKKNIV